MYLQNRQTFHIFSLLDLHFVLCSHNLDMRKGSYSCRLFTLIIHKSTRPEIQSHESIQAEDLWVLNLTSSFPVCFPLELVCLYM